MWGIKDVADYLNVDYKTAKKLAEMEGGIRCVNLGTAKRKLYRTKKEWVDEWLEERSCG